MKESLKKHQSKLRFALVGGTNTAIDFGVLFLLNWLGINKYLANFLSTSVAFVFSFFANRKFTFKSSGAAKKQIVPFLVVTLTGLWILQPIIIWISSLSLGFLEENVALLIGKLAATVVSMVWNYVLYSRVVFNDRDRLASE